MELSEKVRFEIVVSDNFVEPTVQAIVEGARTGEVGDGKIFVVAVERVVRLLALAVPLRVGERDEGLGLDVTEHGEEAYVHGDGAILLTAD